MLGKQAAAGETDVGSNEECLRSPCFAGPIHPRRRNHADFRLSAPLARWKFFRWCLQRWPWSVGRGRAASVDYSAPRGLDHGSPLGCRPRPQPIWRGGGCPDRSWFNCDRHYAPSDWGRTCGCTDRGFCASRCGMLGCSEYSESRRIAAPVHNRRSGRVSTAKGAEALGATPSTNSRSPGSGHTAWEDADKPRRLLGSGIPEMRNYCMSSKVG